MSHSRNSVNIKLMILLDNLLKSKLKILLQVEHTMKNYKSLLIHMTKSMFCFIHILNNYFV